MNGKGKRQFQTALNILGPFLGLILVIVLFSLLPEVQDRFLRVANLKSVATQSVIVALGALGMTLVIIGGGIDLSAASNIALRASSPPTPSTPAPRRSWDSSSAS